MFATPSFTNSRICNDRNESLEEDKVKAICNCHEAQPHCSSCRKYCKGNLVKADLCIKVREGERKNDMCMTEKAHNDDGLWH